ncbi:hypothetical protein HH213_18030 [Duganella dendranthematis]|uniref:Uncharacterized protein n=1 Tax=Duganella dendranthematis TaxID=2728021 RepID=A0ABX6MBW2_9BURK|nr:hypothetical protein [Duganella dendranthematis]QJD91822.1 hypothetical protein HH213_18030 [Duganella dendranthematis]
MSKFYVTVLRPSGIDGCIIDLEKLPPGANSHEVSDPWIQGADLTFWFKEDLDRSARIVQNIKNRTLDDETLDFISRLASFWENLPPAEEEKDGFLAASKSFDSTRFLRTSPEVAKEMWESISKIGKPKD